MLAGEKLSFSYDDKEFINNLDIKVEKGKITTIIGPNGSGKSTLLSMLCSVNKIKKGSIYIDGKNIVNYKSKSLARIIATVYQQNNVPEDIIVEDLVGYGRIPHKGYFEKNNEDDNKIIEWAIKSTNVEHLKNKPISHLSGGERQRVFIALALAQKPKILFLDEPNTYLDIFNQIELLELVKKLNEENNITVVMVLHDINQAVKYSDNLVIMKNGKIIKVGKSDDVINAEIIESVYNVKGIVAEVESKEKYFIPLSVVH
ncbi:ABC transporter ATP-binding protein [Clostridium chauvoei]|uniref:ABC transporter ATP-binding protein n=2 Tax=Clostridium chauvoei TaxID=46867 RepID=A0ABD4RIC3_9CLOT|nr:ABC transporter ATP-binding protein [Clostridium chauvoei]ATD55903.1 iron ABC transporter ATP-binding protein [Clostridium chauvoei]ATD56425.1 iron ABC transporter ATP-binding protein [Clostridium chauvoei]MBX7281126.1 ABC transporter ATP-binding protein [Clostridium chauvoei]MBX7283608.1 ABC transporter ATP-binding protein [Clostridium chauvoei]MBX7286216.1 ABC transporter ATP-binding protein [Clostridium chauvoei]